MKKIQIEKTNCNFERELLLRPFGFKGGYTTELWQTIVSMQSSSGKTSVGIGTQCVLWSDAKVFASHSEAGSNSLMFAVTQFALKRIQSVKWTTPIELLEKILEDAYEYGKKVTNNPKLKLTFILNALVAVDNAVWILFAGENGITNFDDMIPQEYRKALSHRHKNVASIPLMAYAIPLNEVINSVRNGYFFLKIKIGSDPEKDGDREKMLQWDMRRIEEIHKAVGGVRTPYTKDGKIPYYLDANGRYDSKERLKRLLDHTEKIGAFDQIAILEEPFPEEYEENVGDLGVRIAADESAHSDKDVERRIQMGYGAIALKPIAKTLSMSLKILKIAHEKNIPCFCADLTVIPILVDWNKNVAARLAPLPGMNTGVLETNGHQNYKRWDELLKFHPCYGAEWTKTKNGLFYLNDDFYNKSGGIFEIPKHYRKLVE